MSLKPLRIISIGRIRMPFWRDASAYYLEKLSHWRKVTETVLKDAPAELPQEQRARDESQRLVRRTACQEDLVQRTPGADRLDYCIFSLYEVFF